MLMVKERRIEHKMSQLELARRSGVSQQNISLIENGVSVNVGILTLEAIARALGCKLEEIYKPDTIPAA